MAVQIVDKVGDRTIRKITPWRGDGPARYVIFRGNNRDGLYADFDRLADARRMLGKLPVPPLSTTTAKIKKG